MYSISVKCLIFTLIIDFYLLFDQSTGGKKKKMCYTTEFTKKKKVSVVSEDRI
jgi:hypothetical protein